MKIEEQYDKNGRRIGKRKYPLRKVIQEGVIGTIRDVEYNNVNLLECGHYVFPVSDIYGERFPNSQRCFQCYKLINPLT